MIRHSLRHDWKSQLERVQGEGWEPKSILEVGVYSGNTLFAFAKTYPQARVVGIDSFVGLADSDVVLPHVVNRLREHPHVELLVGPSDQMCRYLSGMYDLVHIDGDHTYEGVKSDWLIYSTMVNPGGIMMMHDYHDIERWFSEMPGDKGTLNNDYCYWRPS